MLTEIMDWRSHWQAEKSSKQILQIYDRKTVLHYDFSHFDWPKLYKKTNRRLT